MDTLIAFAKRNGIESVIRASELPPVGTRYDNAPGLTERMYRYAQSVLDDFPRAGDARPARALANFRDHFAQHIDVLKAEIVRWKADRKQQHRTLTDVLWYMAHKIRNAEGDNAFLEPNGTGKPMLRFGLLTLGKILCTEADSGL